VNDSVAVTYVILDTQIPSSPDFQMQKRGLCHRPDCARVSNLAVCPLQTGRASPPDKWIVLSCCREVGWVGLRGKHKSGADHKLRTFSLSYPKMATRKDWNLQVKAEAEAEGDRYQRTSAAHEEHEYRDWTAEDLEDAGL